MLDSLCDLELCMTLTLNFQGQILKRPYPRNGKTSSHGTKGIWVIRKSDPLCVFEFCLDHPWPWPWILKVKFCKSCISRMKGLINVTWNERDVCLLDVERTLWPWVMTFTWDFQGQILKWLYPWSRVADWYGMKGMWVNRKSDLLCGFDLDLTHDPP